MIDVRQLQDILPQAFPFVFIDRIVDFQEGKSLKAIKNLTANEWGFTQGGVEVSHFTETLLIEAASQAALALYQLSKIKPGQKRPQYILGKITAEFEKEVCIGDHLTIEALANKMLDTGGYSDVTISVDAQRVANIEIIYSVKRERD